MERPRLGATTPRFFAFHAIKKVHTYSVLEIAPEANATNTTFFYLTFPSFSIAIFPCYAVQNAAQLMTTPDPAPSTDHPTTSLLLSRPSSSPSTLLHPRSRGGFPCAPTHDRIPRLLFVAGLDTRRLLSYWHPWGLDYSPPSILIYLIDRPPRPRRNNILSDLKRPITHDSASREGPSSCLEWLALSSRCVVGRLLFWFA